MHAVDAAASFDARKLRQSEVVAFFCDLSPCVIGIKACGTAHYEARELIAWGHTVRLIVWSRNIVGIRSVADTGGLIGVNALSVLLVWSRKDAPNADTGPFPPPPLASISKYVDVVYDIRHLVGIDYIGIGSDFTFGSAQITPFPSQSFLYPPEMTNSQRDGLVYVRDFNRVGDLPVLRAELVRRG
jgi:microsomal dipeptidase-like Zn-dependent dipeptidase